MIDGLDVAGQCCVVALVICTDGTKIPVGLWLGDTENKTVVTHLLVRPRRPGPVGRAVVCWRVIDGAKALAAGVQEGLRRHTPKFRVALCTSAGMSRDICPRSSPTEDRLATGPGLRRSRPGQGPRPSQAHRRRAQGRSPRRRGQPARRPRGHVHRSPPRHQRPHSHHPDQHQLHRVDDLGRPHHHGHASSAGKTGLNEEALGRRWDARSRTIFRRVRGCKEMPPSSPPSAATPPRDRHTRNYDQAAA